MAVGENDNLDTSLVNWENVLRVIDLEIFLAAAVGDVELSLLMMSGWTGDYYNVGESVALIDAKGFEMLEGSP